MSGPAEEASRGDLARHVAAAAARTTGAGTARLAHTKRFTWPWRDPTRQDQAQGGFLRLDDELAKRAEEKLKDSNQMEGLVEFGARRYVMRDAEAEVLADGSMEIGSGRGPWSERADRRGVASTLFDPFWMVEALAGCVAAEPAGEEVVRGTRCRRFRAQVDLVAASEASVHGMAPPPAQPAMHGLRRFALEVWLDEGGRARRIRAEDAVHVATLELFDFGHSSRFPRSRPGLRRLGRRRRAGSGP